MPQKIEIAETKQKYATGNVYWHDGIPALLPTKTVPLSKVDVVVIGAGYTGLQAAIATARAGRLTQVVDMHELGWGCSTRNGGQISPSIKPSFSTLAQRHGTERAAAIRNEGIGRLIGLVRLLKPRVYLANISGAAGSMQPTRLHILKSL